MALFGSINRFCPCCGKLLYDNKLPTTCKAACCSTECFHEWEMKMVRGILGGSEGQLVAPEEGAKMIKCINCPNMVEGYKRGPRCLPCTTALQSKQAQDNRVRKLASGVDVKNTKPRGLVPTLDDAIKNAETIKRVWKVLKRLEWIKLMWLQCPICNGIKPGEVNDGIYDHARFRVGHTKRCALAKLIKETKQ